MRRLALSILLALAVLFIAAGSAGATRRPKHVTSEKCPRTHTHVLLANAQVALYIAPTEVGLEPLKGVYGCAYGHQRSYVLGGYEPDCLGSSSGGGCGGLNLEVLAGPIAAYAEAAGNATETSYQVFVRDLRNGRLLHKVPTGGKPIPKHVGIGPAIRLVVKSNGAAAWIVASRTHTSAGEPPAEYEVHAVDRSGARVLAAGTDIDPSSLALARSTLYWTQDGKPTSTVLN